MHTLTLEYSCFKSIPACSVNSFVTLCLFSRTYVANRVSDKLTEISPHVFCCRSGSSADTQAIADLVKYQLNLHRYIHTPQNTIMPLNPLDAVEICLNKHKVMYSVLMPSIITPTVYKFLWTYRGSGHIYVSVAG